MMKYITNNGHGHSLVLTESDGPNRWRSNVHVTNQLTRLRGTIRFIGRLSNVIDGAVEPILILHSVCFPWFSPGPRENLSAVRRLFLVIPVIMGED